MKAIRTRYTGCTPTLPARIIASDEDGNRASVTYVGGCGPLSHWPAVQALCERMQWSGRIMPGSLRNGYVWVWLDHEAEDGRTIARPAEVNR
jgi:hypothetical protein